MIRKVTDTLRVTPYIDGRAFYGGLATRVIVLPVMALGLNVVGLGDGPVGSLFIMAKYPLCALGGTAFQAEDPIAPFKGVAGGIAGEFAMDFVMP